jgi:hypothetical protein
LLLVPIGTVSTGLGDRGRVDKRAELRIARIVESTAILAVK